MKLLFWKKDKNIEGQDDFYEGVLKKFEPEIDSYLDDEVLGGMLITGFKGVGKTTLVNETIKQVIKNRNKQNYIVANLHIQKKETLNHLYRKVIRSIYFAYERKKLSRKTKKFPEGLERLYEQTFYNVEENESSVFEHEVKSAYEFKINALKLSSLIGAVILVVLAQIPKEAFDEVILLFKVTSKWEQFLYSSLLGFGGALFSATTLFANRSFMKRKTSSYLKSSLFDDEIMEYRLFDVLRDIKSKKEEIIIVFDELDKIPSEHLDETLGLLKPLIWSGLCRCIVIAGPVMSHKFHRSQYLGDSTIASLFSRNIHIPLGDVDFFQDVLVKCKKDNLKSELSKFVFDSGWVLRRFIINLQDTKNLKVLQDLKFDFDLVVADLEHIAKNSSATAVTFESDLLKSHLIGWARRALYVNLSFSSKDFEVQDEIFERQEDYLRVLNAAKESLIESWRQKKYILEVHLEQSAKKLPRFIRNNEFKEEEFIPSSEQVIRKADNFGVEITPQDSQIVKSFQESEDEVTRGNAIDSAFKSSVLDFISSFTKMEIILRSAYKIVSPQPRSMKNNLIHIVEELKEVPVLNAFFKDINFDKIRRVRNYILHEVSVNPEMKLQVMELTPRLSRYGEQFLEIFLVHHLTTSFQNTHNVVKEYARPGFRFDLVMNAKEPTHKDLIIEMKLNVSNNNISSVNRSMLEIDKYIHEFQNDATGCVMGVSSVNNILLDGKKNIDVRPDVNSNVPFFILTTDNDLIDKGRLLESIDLLQRLSLK